MLRPSFSHRAALLVLVVLCMSAAPAWSQSGAGVRFGLNGATVSGDSAPDDAERRTGFHLGVQFLLDTPGVLDVQPEFLYSQKGYTVGDFTQQVGYIQLNSLFKVRPPTSGSVSGSVFLGPGFAFEVGETASFDDSSEESDAFTTTDVSAIIGFGLDFSVGSGAFMIDLRYDIGLTNIADTENDDVTVKNRTLGLSAGLLF